MDTVQEIPGGHLPEEPSKWNLLAWIWWRLGEPSPGEPEPYFTSNSLDDLDFVALIANGWF